MVDTTPYQQEQESTAVVSVASGVLRNAQTPSGNTSKYYIYSSKAGKTSDANTKVLSQDQANLDNFLYLLPDHGIILNKTSESEIIEVDVSDKWRKWMTNWGTSCTLSVTVDNTKDMNIQSFGFRLAKPYELAFSSSPAALYFSFQQDVIPFPGIDKNGYCLYFGLHPGLTRTITTTIEDIFNFANLGDALKRLPDTVANLTVRLDRSKSKYKRNAFWFTPDEDLGTIIRLQLEIDDAEKCLAILNDKLPNLKFTSANLICRKEIVLADTDEGQSTISIGSIAFEISCTITPKDKSGIDMILALEISENEFDLTFNAKDPSDGDTFTNMMTWLLDVLGKDCGVDGIKTLLEKDNIFKGHIHLRRLKITLDVEKGSPELSDVMVDIEVSGTFGQGDTGQRAPFLVTYSWSADGGRLGCLTGDFWNCEVRLLSKARLRSPVRGLTDLEPITANPLKVLDLVTLIPGVAKIPDIPDTVPTKISRAGIYLTQDICIIGVSIKSKAHEGADQSGNVPRVDLGRIDINASFSWGKSKDYTLELAFTTLLIPSENSNQKEKARLTGVVTYDSHLGWQLEAKLNSLYASTLCEFFDAKSARHVLPLLDSLKVGSMHLLYKYEKESTLGRSVGSSFEFTGAILVGGLELDLNFHSDAKGWNFAADLKATNDKTTLGDILASMLGDNDLDLPPFLADTPFNGDKKSGNTIHLELQKGNDGFHLLTNIVFKPVEVVFAQFHSNDWPASTPSKRLVKAGIVALPSIPIPLIGDLTQPFDEMYLLWVQDAANLSKDKQAQPGLTVVEINDLNKSLRNYPLAYSNKSKDPKNTDVVITAGAHFCVVLKDQNNTRTMVLDYSFKKTQPQAKKQVSARKEAGTQRLAGQEKKPDSDGSSSSAPFKKKAGPLSISNLGLKYADKKLHIILTATMELGPVGLSLIGFSLDINLAVLKKFEPTDISVSLEGLAVAFERPPLTIAGIIRHGKDPNLEYYAGGLIIGWVPYEIQAAGFYGRATPDGGKPFVSVFVFARLDGPLVSLEFAEISGVTGGFGYNSNVQVPTAEQIVNFPFIKQDSLGDEKDSALDTLKKLTEPGKGGWFSPRDGTYWAAVGMKIDAFQLIALDAVVVVQFGESIKLGIFAVAAVDIPNPKFPNKFAHAELGIAVVVDFAYGVVKSEAQLSPNSYILHPSCHLTGGFALYYWFEAPHADHSKVGEFVFSMGGYHPAYEVLEGYPNPPRLGISWSLGGGLSITGQAYFAITPKACMGGGRLHAALHTGPLEAWFDAFANFLINYKPFHFVAKIGVDVGVRFNVDVWFVHTHVSVDVGAELTMWGPPLAGRVHINLKVVKFDMNFGDAGENIDPVSLLEFYQLVLQTDKASKVPQAEERALTASGVIELEEEQTEEESGKKSLDMPDDEGHTFLAESGLMNDTDKPARKHNQPWLVRGGTFMCVLGCKMAIRRAEMEGDTSNYITYDQAIYAKPMKLTEQTSGLESTLQISIKRKDTVIKGWKMERVVKSLPAGLWGKYKSGEDPLKNGNNIPDLLSSSSGTIELLAGVRLTAPPPKKSEDPYPVFDVADAELQTLFADRPFPKAETSSDDWEPAEVLEGKEQWETVRRKWASPDWSQGGKRDVQKEFVSGWAAALGWEAGLSKWAKMPKGVHDQFDKLYVAAPLITNEA